MYFPAMQRIQLSATEILISIWISTFPQQGENVYLKNCLFFIPCVQRGLNLSPSWKICMMAIIINQHIATSWYFPNKFLKILLLFQMYNKPQSNQACQQNFNFLPRIIESFSKLIYRLGLCNCRQSSTGTRLFNSILSCEPEKLNLVILNRK